MFDISFTQLLVVVTVSGYILGRKDMKNLAKLVGGGVGKFVGSLQGMRVKYEQKSQNQNVELKTLHTSVRSGLRGISPLFPKMRRNMPPFHRYVILSLFHALLIDQICQLLGMIC